MFRDLTKFYIKFFYQLDPVELGAWIVHNLSMVHDTNIMTHDSQAQAVSYIRCSLGTERQRNSLAVQRQLISQFATANGYELVGEFCDEETGRTIDRAGLLSALKYSVENNCRILVYRCDRLSRNQAIWSLIEDRLDDFRFVELGSDVVPNLFVLSVLLAAAANESAVLSSRVSSSMQHLIQQGRTFGNPRIHTTAHPASLKVRKSNAADFNQKIQGIVSDLFKSGYNTLQEQAARLNDMGLGTRRGASWSAANLQRVMAYSV